MSDAGRPIDESPVDLGPMPNTMVHDPSLDSRSKSISKGADTTF